MGLFSVLGTSSAGLKSIQDNLSLVSQNIAGANRDGYVRRVQSPVVNSPGGTSVGSGAVERALDRYVQMSLWKARTGAAYGDRVSDAISQVNMLFGKPGAESGLPSLLSKFQNALKTLASDPASAATRSQVVGQIKLVINSIRGISDGIQAIRASAEVALDDQTDQLNLYLQQVDGLNRKIGNLGSDPALLDQRDTLIGQISSLIGITVHAQNDGTIQITTDTGAVLVDQSGAARLSFDARRNISAADRYAVDPLDRSVGTLTMTSPGGATLDMIASGFIRSGEIGALVELRDQSLVQAQGQIDDFAAALSQVFSDQSIAGEPIAGGQSIDLAGLKSGNRIALEYTDAGGVTRRINFVAVAQASSLPLPDEARMADGEETVGIDLSTGYAGIAAAMQSAIASRGGGLSVAASGTRIDMTGASPAMVRSLTARVTNASLGANSAGLPLFTDGATASNLFTDHYDGGRQRMGFASRISLNPLIAADPSLLVTWGGTSSATDNAARANQLGTLLATEKKIVSSQSQFGFSNGEGTVTDILNQFIQQQSISTNNAESFSEIQSVTLNYMEAKFKSLSGVNMDTELANMTSLQTAYAANARVMTTARDMLDILMRI